MKRCGEWVRFKEATKKIEDLKQALLRSEEIRAGMRVECNCVDESARARKKAESWALGSRRLSPHWLCPAHGYKRL